MVLTTERLILRAWKENDAASLYEYAKDPKVGPAAGWPVHTSIDNSKQIIKTVLSIPETYAIVLKGTNVPIGSIGLMMGKFSDLNINYDEGEIGYWLASSYWGKGLMPEAVRELLRHGFEDLKLKTIWCGYFEGNNNSKRVQEKCGFKYHHKLENKKRPLINEVGTEYITCIKNSYEL